jgi:hypothetical protein
MTGPAERTVKRLFALSKNRCAFPQCQTNIVDPRSETIVGDICHIKAHKPGGPRFDPKQTDEERHSFENLILFCTVCHRLVDDRPDIYCIELLQEMKGIHEKYGDIELSIDGARMAQKLFKQSQIAITATDNAQVMVASPGAIQAQHLTIKTSRKKTPSAVPTQGGIGHNLAKRNYTLHLMERYNDFQKADTSKPGVGKYIVLGRAIKAEFGSKWDFVPESKFFELIAFIQRRILNTRIGRIQNSRGQKCFSSWEEWLSDHH